MLESAIDDALGSALVASLSSGPTTAAQLQRLTGKSQPTVSRALHALGARVVALGAGKATRYGLARQIRGAAGQQPLWWTSASGELTRWGTLSFLAPDTVHVAAPGIDSLVHGELPWFLSPLQPQGYLGREWGRRLGLERDPAQWSLEEILHAALRIEDAPGAISIGEPMGEFVPEVPVNLQSRARHYDGLAADVASRGRAGSSAGGEQAKFLTGLASGERVLVKFTPPRGTPFGERWHDLLHAEALALQVLGEHGVSVASARIVESPQRTYLESTRFDRMPPSGLGRRHVVTLDAVHRAFVHGARENWAATCDALALQRRLDPLDARAARALLTFGRLIGNTDMHFGNLSLWADDPAQARFALAPLCDMLPMRWRPDGFHGMQDCAPFEVPPPGADGATPRAGAPAESPRTVAQTYWRRAAMHAAFSPEFRAVAAEMARRLSA